MDSRLINRQQLPASRWQQDDTPCFVPFPNQSLKYWITTLLIAMMSIVGAWGESNTFGPGKSTWETDGAGTYTVTLKAKGDLKSMEGTWYKGKTTPWVAGSKIILIIDENMSQSTFESLVGNDELYLLCQVPDATLAATSVSTLDLSNLTSEQALYLNPNNQWPSQWQKAWDCNLTNIIVPNSYASSPQNYTKTGINSIGKSGETLYLYKQSYSPIIWSDVRDSETTLKLMGVYGSSIDLIDAKDFTTIDLRGATFSGTDGWEKFNLPTVGDEGVALTKIIVSDATMKGRVTPTDATTQAAIEIAGGSGGGEGGDDPDPNTLEGKIALKMQLSNVPTVYLTIPDVNDIDNDLRKYDSNGIELANPYHSATIQVIDGSEENSVKHLENFTDEVEIKVRGNSTSRVSKRPYRLKFPKKHKHDLLGDGYTKRNWTLLANAFDKSLLRNAVTYHLGKYVGMPFTAGYKFVDLVINNQYRGCYQISDHLQADKDRININEDTGWYLEYQGTRPDMLDDPNLNFKRGTSGEVLENAHNVNIKNPDCDELTETQIDSLKNKMNTWLNTWQGGFQTYTCGSVYGENGWRKYNDMNTAVRYCILTEITGDYDGFMTTKFYREGDDTDKLHWGPTWDKDLAYGNYGDLATSVVASIGNSGTIGGYAMQLYSDPYFIKQMKETMDSLVSAGILNNIITDISTIASGLTETRALDYEKWGDGNLGIETQYGLTDYSIYVQKVKDWFTNRIPWVKAKITEMYNNVWADENIKDFTYDASKAMGDNGFFDNKDKLLNVTMSNRSFVANQWDAICLPFDVSAEQMTSIFGTGYELKEYIGVSNDGRTMLFSTVEGGSAKAATPYLIKPTQDVNGSPIFSKTMLYYSNPQIKGKAITFGNYTLQGYMFADGMEANGTVRTLNNDGSTLTTPTKTNTGDTSIAHYGAFAYIKVANDALDPIIDLNGTITPPVVRTQLTTLPTIYIDTQDGAAIQSSAGEWVAAGIQVIDAKGNLKPFTQEIGLTSAGKNILQIRGRGTTSWTNTDKKSYRLQFGKDEKDNLGNVTTSYKHNLMVNEDGAGVVKKRNWVLLANSGDKTLVRNALTKEIGDAVGLPFTPGYRFVDLVLNGTYVGTYQVTEFLEADANRVNIDEDKGLLIQMTGSTDADLTNDHVISGEDYTKPYLTIKNPEVKAKDQETWNKAFNRDVYDFDGMWEANDGTGLNKESLVNWYIASEIIGDYEALSSIYAYKDKNATELSFGPLWGTETAYDNNASITMTSAGLMSDEDDNSTHTGLMTKAGKQSAWQTKIEGLWAQPWFANAVRLRWNTLYNNGALTTTLKNKVTTLAGIVNATDDTFTTSSQAKNFTATADGGAGWSLAGQGITDYSKNIANDATYETEIARLKTYIETRLPYLDKKFKALDGTIEYDVTRSDAISAYSIYNGQTANVTLKNRGTITSAYFNPITFPFSLTDAKLKEVFGSEYDLESFASITTESDNTKLIKLNFSRVNAADAGVPYLIKPETDVTNLTFNGVTFDVSEEKSVEQADHYFRGLLKPQSFVPDQTHLFVGKNNQFIRLNGNATLSGTRAYFTIPSASYSKQFILGGFDDITGVENIIINTDSENNQKVYNLSGQIVGTSLKNLPKGVYIVNGKKIVR